MSYDYSVVSFLEKRVAGVKTATDMQKAMQDCMALWTTFGAWVEDLAANGVMAKGGDTFGVAVMTGAEGQFDYWATVELAQDAKVPGDLTVLTIPAGLYVRCTVASLDDLGTAFMALYGEWPQSQSDYTIDMQGLCFERYPSNWEMNDPFEIYAAVKKL